MPSVPGILVLMGGAVTPRGSALRAFIQRAHAVRDMEPRIVGITAASGNPEAAARQWRRDLREAGCRHLDIPLIATRAHACDETLAPIVANADGIFLGGGDQVKLVSTLAGTPVERAMHEAHARGAVMGGTSAGAAALAKTTLAGNEIDERGNLVEQYIGPGLGFITHPTIIDTHFSQRRRLYRLFVAIAEYQDLLGVGIDEDTALVINGHHAHVVGAGGVTFVDGRDITYTNAGHVREGQALTLSAMRVGLIGPGTTFDLRTREIVVPAAAPEPIPVSST